MPSFGSAWRTGRPSGRCWLGVVVIALALLPAPAHAQSSQAARLYQEALSREKDLRKELDATPPAANTRFADVITRVRILARTYEDLWRLFPTSGYSDNALWQGAMLAADAFWHTGDAADRTRALRLLDALTRDFPTSSLLKQVPAQKARLQNARVSVPAIPPPATRTDRPADAPPTPSSPAPAQRGPVPAPASTGTVGNAGNATAPPSSRPTSQGTDVRATAAPEPSTHPAASAAPRSTYTTLTGIRREVLPDVLRVILELEQEPVFHAERIDGPPRVFIDMQNTRASERMRDASLPFRDDVVRQIRVGRQLNGRTRVVLDLADAGRHSVYALYNPFRIVIDVARKNAAATPTTRVAAAPPPGTTPTPTTTTPESSPATAASATRPRAAAEPPPPARETAVPASRERREAGPEVADASTTPATRPGAPVASAPPLPPAANSTGSFSLSRQLGLGIARIVIDPGHGGHDPGAKVKGLTEAQVTLDVALRLEKLFAKGSGVEVILTRRTDAFVPLQERTAIANQSGADLFLSIHVNASEDASLRGVETYFLNLSPNPEAARLAARENAASAKTMHDVADIVRAIALNDKIDESRDFAAAVQDSLYDGLRTTNRTVRNLGVKQAPFMVLIGATMPSILAEISFLTNKQEGSLLKTEKYRQQIAEALYRGVLRYQQSLKKAPAVALRDTATR